MKIGAIILVRYSSSRLPGKALLEIHGKKVLEYIIERLQKVLPNDQIFLATSDHFSDDPIATFAKSHNIHTFRGDLDNVAKRFLDCGKYFELDYAIRINGDNIFLDTNVLSKMITRAMTGEYDFISNVKDRTFPKGMSIEIINLNYYESIYEKIGQSEYHKEHVTSYLYEVDSKNNLYIRNTRNPEYAGVQMALDTPEDLERTREIINRFTKPHWEYNMDEIMKITKALG